MTEAQLTEAVGLVARCRRWEHIAETKHDTGAALSAKMCRLRLRELGVEIEARGWQPPAGIGPEVA